MAKYQQNWCYGYTSYLSKKKELSKQKLSKINLFYIYINCENFSKNPGDDII